VQFPRATRLVICCRGTASEAMTAMRVMMSRLKLTVNETKTRRCKVPEETFDFLGYTIGLCRSQTGKSYIGTRPSVKKVKGLCLAISEQTSRRWGLLDVEEMVGRLNRKLDGWANYFWLGQVSKAYRAVDSHARRRLRHWLCRKHQVGGRGTSRFPDVYLHQILGLTRLEGRKRSFV
jgi:RNA-directed DNA polymerase